MASYLMKACMRSLLPLCAMALLLPSCARSISEPLSAPNETPTAGTTTTGKGADEAQQLRSEAPKEATRTSRPVVPMNNYQALNEAREALDQHGADSAQFQWALRKAGGSFPEVKVTVGEAPLAWNKLTLNSLGAGFEGFRFRCPLDGWNDMHWVFTPSRSFESWYIASTDGSLGQGFYNFTVDWNLAAPGAHVPPGQIFYLQTLLNGLIRPGTEYVVWIADKSTAPIDMHLAIRLCPQGSHGAATDVAGVAQALRLDVQYPQFTAPRERLPEMFSAARDLLIHRAAPASLQRLLKSVRGDLSELTVPAGSPPATWNRISADQSFGFHAVRFKVPFDAPTDLYLALLLQNDLVVCSVVPADGEVQDVDLRYKLEVDVPFDDQQQPRDNLLSLMALQGGKLQPGREYFLCFRPVTGILRDIRLALRFTPSGTSAAGANARAIAETIGLKLPDGPPSAERVAAAFRRCRTMVDQRAGDDYTFYRLLEFALPVLPELKLSGGSPVWNTIEAQAFPERFGAFQFKSTLAEPADLHFLVVKPENPKIVWACAGLDPDVNRLGNPTVQQNVAWEGQAIAEGSIAGFQSAREGCILPNVPHVVFFVPQGNDPLTLRCALRLSKPDEFPPSSSTRALAARFGLKPPAPAAVPGGRAFDAHGDGVTDVAMTADGKLATASIDGAIKIWQVETGQLLRTILTGKEAIDKMCLSRSGSHLAAAKGDEILVWNMQTYEISARLPTLGLLPRCLCLSADGRWLAGCSWGFDRYQQERGIPGVLLWDLNSPGRPRPVHTAGAIIKCLALTDDGRTLILGGFRPEWAGKWAGSVLQFVDRESLRVEQEITDETNPWTCMAISADGKKLAGAREHFLLQVWDLATRKVVASVSQDLSPESIAISDDGADIATAANDGTVRLWDAASLRMSRLWRGYERNAFAFTPTSREVVSGGLDGTVRIWDVQYRGEAPSQPGYFDPLTNSVGMKLMPIPAGRFTMGLSPTSGRQPENADDELPRHPVQISRPFYMAAHEVTVAQFREFVDDARYVTTAETSAVGGSAWRKKGNMSERVSGKDLTWRHPDYPQQDRFPVVQVSFHDAVAFCDWLSRKENARYRLPTEAEWEYACRAGSTTPTSFGADWGDLKFCANVEGIGTRFNDSFQFAAPVGSFLPNAFGLFDMHGNVYEWCSDWFGERYYQLSEAIDPGGPSSGDDRVQRSGSFSVPGGLSRSCARRSAPPGEARYDLGFRVVREMH